MGLYVRWYNLWPQTTNTLLCTGKICFTRPCMLSELCCEIAPMRQCMRDSLNSWNNFCWDFSSVMALTARPHFVRHIHKNKYNSPADEVELQEASQHYALNQHSGGGQLNISVSDLAPGVSDIQEGSSSSDPINFLIALMMHYLWILPRRKVQKIGMTLISTPDQFNKSDGSDSLSDSYHPNPSNRQDRVRTKYFWAISPAGSEFPCSSGWSC